MAYVRVVYDTFGYQCEEPSDDYLAGEPYSRRGTTNADISVQGIEVVKEKDWYDVVTDFAVKKNVQYYLLYAVYETGDSFGRDGGRTEWIGLYRDFHLAQAQAEKIEQHANEYDRRGQSSSDAYTVKIVADNGTEYPLHTPWNGYFEHLQYVSVEGVMINRRYRSR